MQKYAKLLTLSIVAVFTLSACSLFGGAEELGSEDEQQSFLEEAAQNFDDADQIKLTGSSDTVQAGETITLNIEIEIDGDNSRMMWQSGDASVYMANADGTAYISADGDEWYDLGESSDADSITSPDEFTSFAEVLGEDDYEYIGLEDCDSGKCQVFEYSDEDATTTIYVDANDKRVSEVKETSTNFEGEEESSTLVVSYDVSVEAPENAEELSEEEAANKALELIFGFFSDAGIEL